MKVKLENTFLTSEIVSLFRKKKLSYVKKSVNILEVESYIAEGWFLKRDGKNTSQLIKNKSHDTELDDRVWSLLYRLGYIYMSGSGGAKLLRDNGLENQIDNVAIDDEVSLMIECKSAENQKKNTRFQDQLGKFCNLKKPFSIGVRDIIKKKKRLPLGAIFFVRNLDLTENDLKRAKDEKVQIFDESDLEYYEKLVNHIGSAAKYQLHADIFHKKVIPGLEIKVPALKSKIGPFVYYTFSIKPEYLLKIGFISHRSKGKASDVNTYQRLMSKARDRTPFFVPI